MMSRVLRGLGVFLVLLLLFPGQTAWASDLTSITLAEALDLALRQNTSHTLFLREQELSEKREVLKKHPTIMASTQPVGLTDGQLQGPTGNLTLTMPLGDHLDLKGTVTLGLNRDGVSVKPSGSLNLNYAFFALPEKASGELTPAEVRQRQTNSLILQTVDQLIQLRKTMDRRDYEQARLRYLEASLDAARATPNYDDLDLRRQLREQVAQLAALEEELEYLQLNLGVMLGTSLRTYDPVLNATDLPLPLLEEVLRDELFASNETLRRAQANLARAQDALALERKSRGWDVQVSGGLHGNAASGSRFDESATSGPWHFEVGLMATKIMYPHSIILEELELAVAQAEYELEMGQNALDGELRGAIQRVQASLEQLQLKAEHLQDAREDLDYRRRQFEAGLVTQLQVQDTELALQKAILNAEHEKLHYAQSILNLWNLCNRDLQRVIYEVMN